MPSPPPQVVVPPPPPAPRVLPPAVPELPDFWENPAFDKVGEFAPAVAVLAVVLAVIAGGIASNAYDQGAVGIDYGGGTVDGDVATAAALAAAGLAAPKP